MDESNKYTFSVIIPNFSRGGNCDMLIRAVSSVPERDDIQVLVVDNSLTPIPRELFPERKNVRVIYSPNERKAGGARNVGMDNSDAKWYLFLDADDFFTENAFEFFDKHINSDSDIVFFMPDSAFNDNLMIKSGRSDGYEKMIKKYIKTSDDTDLRINFPPPWSKMVSSTMVKSNDIRFDEVAAGNDVMFALKIGFAAEKIEVDEHTVYCVTKNEGSLTQNDSLENTLSRFYVNQRRNKLLKENGYKKDASVLLFIIEGGRYGIKPFFSMLHSAIMNGDLFVGANNWPTTFIHMINKK